MIDRARIPTALSPREVRALQEFTRGMKVVEAGALLGFSTLTLAEVAHSVISIDKHEGYGPSTWRAYRSNIEGAGNVIPIKGDAIALIKHLHADRYFLDLDGTFHTTRAVLDAIPASVPVAVHDFRRVNCEGVERACLDLGFDICKVVDTLAIVRRR